MNRLAVLLVLSLIIGVSIAQDTLFLHAGIGNKDNNIVHTVKEPLIIPSNLDNHGQLSVIVTSSTTVIVCINERLQVTAGINTCSPMGRLNFTWTNNTGLTQKEETITKQIYLRFRKTYYISYQFEWNNFETNDTHVNIKITGKKCPDGSAIGPNCGKDQYTTLEAGKGVTATIKANQVHYYYYHQTEKQYNVTRTQLSGIDRSKDKLFLYERRSGLPQFLNNYPVEGTYDWAGDDSNETNIFLHYPKPDEYWFIVASNDTNDVPYTITHNLGTPVTVDSVNASMPEFGTTKDNNTLEYASTKDDGKDFIYFRFDRDELKLGVAPKDDSDDAPDVFADLGFIPSADSNLIANINGSEEAHLLSARQTPADRFFWYTFRADSKAAGEHWYVAINSTNDFVIWDASVGACAKNCTERGVCDESRGVCICDDGYERYDCSDKVFPLVWIILIAIGGAILLAIAIGVPVSCYVKNKKKSGYERV